MPDTEINVVNRPERVVGTVLKLWPIAAAIVPAIVTGALWLVHLEGKTDTNTSDITRVQAALTERDAKWASDQAAQNARVDRIEEGRTVGLQRLAAVEEAVKGQKEILKDISSKLDRALMGGRVR